MGFGFKVWDSYAMDQVHVEHRLGLNFTFTVKRFLPVFSLLYFLSLFYSSFILSSLSSFGRRPHAGVIHFIDGT